MTVKRVLVLTGLIGLMVEGILPSVGLAKKTATTAPAVTQPSLPPPSIEELRKILRARGRRPDAHQTTLPAEMPRNATQPAATQEQPSLPLTTLPAGQRGIQFSFNNAPYSTIFDFVERVTGLPILGDRNVPGTLTYFSRKKMTVNEAMEELNLLLQEKGVVLVRTDDHLRIAKFPDVLRDNSIDFIGADTFLQADVPPNQVVRVFFKVNNLSAEEVTSLLAEALPVNEVKLAAWKTTNQIQVVGLADRVRKIIALAKKLDTELKTTDLGLAFKIFRPKFVTPSTLERIIRSMLPTGGVIPGGGIETGAGGPRPTMIRSGEVSIQIAADDMNGILAVRASSGLIDQIAGMIEKLDVQEETGNIAALRIPIQHGSVQTIEMVLNESIRQRIDRSGAQGRRGGMVLAVRSDEATRSIILAGSRALVEQAEQLVKLLDKPTTTAKAKIIALKSARAEDIVRDVLNPFYRTARREPPATADVLSNSIITWATGTELDEIKSLIEQLDESAAKGTAVPNVRTYRLENIDLNRLVPTLQAMFNKQPNVTFGADPVAKTLIVAAPKEKFERIEKIIDQMKTGLVDSRTTKIVRLKFANPDQIAAVVRGAFGAIRMPTGEPRVELSPNLQAGSILLSGYKDAVEDAAKLINQLDLQTQSSTEIRTFKLTYAQSDDLAKMIIDLYAAKDPTLKVVSEPWSNTLFISGGGGNIDSIKQLIATTDHAEPAEMVSNNIAFITLKTASASDAALQIQSMIGTKGPAGSTPSIDYSDAGNYLIVTGQPKQIERVRQLAEEIDKMSQQVPEILAVRPIQKISAERLAQMLVVIVPQTSGTKVRMIDVSTTDKARGLENLMTEVVPGRPTTSAPAPAVVTIGVDKANNTLIIRGRPREIAEVDKAIETLTTDVKDDVQFKTYVLKFANPVDVAANLESLFNDITAQAAVSPQAQQRPQSQPPTPQADQQQRPTRRQQVQAQPVVSARRIRAIPVDSLNSVVVRADPRDFQTVEEFIEQLDKSDVSKIRIFKLTYARADAVAKNITDIFRASGSTGAVTAVQPGQATAMAAARGRTQMNVSFDTTTNSVIVSASKSDCEKIEELIKALDQPESAGMDIHLIPLTTASAEQLAPTISELLQQTQRTFRRQGLPSEAVAISFDRRTNSLIIAGSNRQYEQVKKLVDKIESTRPSGARRIFILPLKNMDPNQAKQILDQLLPPGGSRGDRWPMKNDSGNWRDRAAAMIFALEVAQTIPPKQPAHLPPSVTTPNTTTRPAIPMSLLKQLIEANRRTAANTTTKPAAVSPPPPATPERFPKSIVSPSVTVPAIPKTPPAPATLPAAAPHVGPPPGAGAQAGAGTPPTAATAQELQTLASQIKGNVQITAVPEQNALIVDASDQDYQIIQQLMNLLDQTRPRAQVQIFKLKNARAQDLADVIGRLFASRPQPRGYPPLSITPDLTTNSLIVSAAPEMIQEIDTVVTQLDAVQPTQQMEIRVFTLKNARASQLVPQIQAMLQQILTARGIAQAPYTITADDRTNTVIVTAPQTYLDQINKLITTLDTVPSFATVDLEIVRLQRASADQMTKVLDGLVNPSEKQQGAAKEFLNRLQLAADRTGEKMTLDVDKPIRYIADKDSQSILLLSNPDNIRVLKKIVTMLDKVPLAEDLKVRIFPLKYADATDAKKTLDDLFSKSDDLTKLPSSPRTGAGGGLPENTTGKAITYRVVLSADAASNALIASGHEESLALVEVLIGQLDQEKAVALFPIKTIGLRNANVVKTAQLLQEVVDARVSRARELGAGKVSSRAKAIIRADERIGVLVISAAPDEFESLKTIIKQLDVAPQPATEPVIIALKNLDAKEAAEMLAKFFKERANYKAPPGEVQPAYPPTAPVIVPDPRSNSLIVSSSMGMLADLKKIVTQLDTVEITRKMRIAVIPLRAADADQLATSIMKILNPSSEQSGLKQAVILEFIRKTPEGKTLIQQAMKDQVYMYGDKTTNLLIALAPEDIIGIIESLAKRIDEVAPQVEMRVIALENADAAQMKKLLDELFGIGKSAQNQYFGTYGAGGQLLGATAAGAAQAIAPGVGTTGFAGAGTEQGISKLEKETLAVTADTRTNSLVVSGTATYINMVADVIKKLDAKAIEQLQTEVIALKNAKAETIQKAVSTLVDNRMKLLQDVYGKEGVAPERVLEQQVNIVSDEDSRKVILQASPRYFADMRKIIEELDEAPSQVMIQAVIIQVAIDDKIEWGFEAVGQDLAFTKGQTAPGIGPGHDVVVGTDVGAAGSSANGGFVFSLHGEDFNLLLRALDSDGKLQVLSRPQIMARDNAEASMQIGSNVPVPNAANIASDTGNITTSFSYEETGVILKVTPHINPDGYVNMEVAPEVSSISSSTVQISSGLNAPIINNNIIKTEVTIKDGETVVIGGLITTRKDHREVKVPFLGDIPILGLFFKSIVEDDSQSELLLVLTPRIIDTIEKARSLSENERDMLILMPKEIRESQLMGRLQITPEGAAPTTQPGGKVCEEGVEPTNRLFLRPTAIQNKLNAFKTTDQQ